MTTEEQVQEMINKYGDPSKNKENLAVQSKTKSRIDELRGIATKDISNDVNTTEAPQQNEGVGNGGTFRGESTVNRLESLGAPTEGISTGGASGSWGASKNEQQIGESRNDYYSRLKSQGIDTAPIEEQRKKNVSADVGSDVDVIKAGLKTAGNIVSKGAGAIYDIPTNLQNLFSSKENQKKLPSDVVSEKYMQPENEPQKRYMENFQTLLAIEGGKFAESKLNIKNATKDLSEAKIKINQIKPTLKKTYSQEILTPQEKSMAISQGRGETDITGKTNIKPSGRDLKVADEVKSIVKFKKPEENIDAVKQTIGKVSQNIEKTLKEKPAIFNKQTISSRFEKIKNENSVIFGDASKSYDSVIDVFMKELDKQPKTNYGLYMARKNTDKIFRNKFGDAIFGDTADNARRNALKDIRNESKTIIDEKMGNKTFSNTMEKENLMYESVDNIALMASKDKTALTAAQKGIRLFKKVAPQVIGGGVVGGAIVGNAINNNN